MEPRTSGTVCTTPYESHAWVLLPPSSQVGLASPCLLPPFLAFAFPSPSYSSSCWCQQRSWLPFSSEWCNLGWEVWSESWDCRSSLLFSPPLPRPLTRLLSGFPPHHAVAIPTTLEETGASEPGKTPRVGAREERLGRGLSVQGLCFLFAELLFPQHAMLSWQSRP